MPAVSPNVSNPISSVALNSSNSLINAMLGGAKWGGISTGPNQTQQTTIYFSFPTATDSSFWSQSDAFGYGYSGDETEGFTTFNSTQIAAATSALQQWANVANINFELVNETTSAVGDIRFGNTTAGAMQPNNYAYTWSLSNISPGVASPDSGDIWLNTFQPVSSGNDYSVGAVGYHTILHEIGHALGVDHTFAEGAGDLGVPVQYDTYQYSVMSYSDKAGSLDDGFSGYYPTTPMLLDIQAIQYLYGANMSYNAGNNVYVFEQNATYYQTIWDGGGNDTIQFNSDSNFPTITTTINLNAGSFSQLGRLFTIGQPYPGGSYDAQGNNVAIAYGAIIENATGGSGSDTLIGNAVSNVLRGGAGNDTINGGAGDDLIFGDADADFMVGGDGSDIYYVDDIADKTIETNAAVAGGIDRVQSTVTYTLSNYIEELFLQGADNINATGNASNNIIRGTTGNNILDGGAGTDDLRGGFGDDTYIVDNAGDQIYDDSGNDTVIVKLASGTFALANYIAANSVENVILFGNASINASGDNGNNVMTGNDGANILDGKAGADAMNGGKGADTYLVNSSGDTVTENFTLALGGGIDLVKSEVEFVLGANVDNLTLMGTDSINGTGNALANIIIGNAGANTLFGEAGNDTLTGNAGSDTLNGDEGNDILQGGDNDDTLTGGAGVDALTGGKGNDTYYIDITRNTALATATLALQDTVSELANPLNSTVEGIDTIVLTNSTGNSGVLGSAGAPIDASNLTNVTTLTVNANLENFDASQTGAIKLNITGNALANIITGNDAANILDGGLNDGKVDTLIGGAGNDTYIVDLATSTVITSGVSTTSLDYSKMDAVTETGSDASDTLKLRGAATLTNAGLIGLIGSFADLENLDVSLTGATKLNLTGNAANNNLVGNAANNILDAGAGADTMAGGIGNDTYLVDDSNDIITELANAGIDTVQTSVTYTLTDTDGIGTNGGNVENLTLINGAGAINGTGNALANLLNGNESANSLTGLAGADTLDGGAGADILDGGDGNDIYIVDDNNDQVIESNATLAVGGTDLVKSNAASYVLTTNVENLTLMGADSINGTGNALANIIIGNAGNNQISGGAANDTLTGNAGNDSLNGDEGNDILQGGDNDDTLTGGAGIDALTGGKGNDTYYIDITRNTALATATLALQDTVSELANPLNSTVEGIDTIVLTNLTGNAGVVGSAGAPIDTSNISTATTLTVNANVENFDASQTGNIKLNITGNALANIITGNDAANILDGGLNDSKVDTLIGGAGDDTYIVDMVVQAPSVLGQPPSFSFTDIIGDSNGIDTLKLRGAVNYGATYIETLRVNDSRFFGLEGIDVSLTGATRFNLEGNSTDNILIGNAFANTITGDFGNDTLDGGAGADNLIGGEGDDVYVIDNIADIVNETGISQDDTIRSSIAINLTSKLIATDPNSVLKYANIENVNLTGAAAVNLTGNAGANLLNGNDGANILDGGIGLADEMNGGKGNDTYIVNNNGDEVYEALNALQGGGIDLVKSRVNFDLGNSPAPGVINYLENLTLTDGTANGGIANINGTGNILNNIIIGNAGNNVLTGGAGIDALTGGKGNDTYYIDLIRTSALATSTIALQDSVVELANPLNSIVEGNNDTIILTNNTGSAGAPIDASNITTATTLTVNANIENFDASQTGAIKLNITGNALANIITGNDAANILDGGLNDSKVDTLIGGAGNDTYIVDMVVVGTGAGAIFSFIDNISDSDGVDTLKLRGTVNYGTTYIQTLNVNDYILLGIEGLDVSLTGATRFNLTGNSGDNNLVGNAFTNTLSGGDGNDILDGGAGNDTLIGGIGNDSLIGGAGVDSLVGGAGDDIYVIDTLLDVIDEAVTNEANDTVQSANLSLDLNNVKFHNIIENAGLLGTVALNLTGNERDNKLAGNDGANILDGAGGADTLIGGKGNDTYIVDSSSDVVEEDFTQLQGGGIDLVKSGVTFVLGNNIENLTLTDGTATGGTADIQGYGNELANTIIGNAGPNALFGNGGNDTLIGNAGNDFLAGGDGNDILNGGVGLDTFYFDFALNALTNKDTIQGFSHVDDTIQLSAARFGRLDLGTLNAANYRVGAAATDADDFIINNAGNLYYDADGNGAVAAIQFATLIGTVGIIGVDDFVIV